MMKIKCDGLIQATPGTTITWEGKIYNVVAWTRCTSIGDTDVNGLLPYIITSEGLPILWWVAAQTDLK